MNFTTHIVLGRDDYYAGGKAAGLERLHHDCVVPFAVMPGLDPGIHAALHAASSMDCRIKSGNDGREIDNMTECDVIDIQAAQKYEDLLFGLQQTGLKVKARSKGRNAKQTEGWTVTRLLLALARADKLQFPLRGHQRDKPDFFLEVPGHLIGIEVTAAINSQLAEFVTTAEREFPGKVFDPSYFRSGSPRRTVAQMREVLSQGRLESDPWAGDGGEREWAAVVQNAIAQKMPRFDASNFTKYDMNWLAIYADFEPPFMQLETAMHYLVSSLADYWRRDPCFDRMFIHHDNGIVSITAHGWENIEHCADV